jgi:hypothetical protein
VGSLYIIHNDNDCNPDLEDLAPQFDLWAAKFQRDRVAASHRELIVVLKSRKETPDVSAYEWLYRMCRMSK